MIPLTVPQLENMLRVTAPDRNNIFVAILRKGLEAELLERRLDVTIDHLAQELWNLRVELAEIKGKDRCHVS